MPYVTLSVRRDEERREISLYHMIDPWCRAALYGSSRSSLLFVGALRFQVQRSCKKTHVHCTHRNSLCCLLIASPVLPLSQVYASMCLKAKTVLDALLTSCNDMFPIWRTLQCTRKQNIQVLVPLFCGPESWCASIEEGLSDPFTFCFYD